jgi:hypothetical protein
METVSSGTQEYGWRGLLTSVKIIEYSSLSFWLFIAKEICKFSSPFSNSSAYSDSQVTGSQRGLQTTGGKGYVSKHSWSTWSNNSVIFLPQLGKTTKPVNWDIYFRERH